LNISRPVQTMHSNHSPIGKETSGYDTGAEYVNQIYSIFPNINSERSPLLRLSRTSHQDTPIHISKGPAQFSMVSSPKNEGATGSVWMAQWKEFLLPDGSRYFLDPILNIVTNYDLRDTERLHDVTRFINECLTKAPPPPEWELWLHNASGSTTAFIPLMAWVHHGARAVMFKRPASDLMEFICKDIDSELLGFMHANACVDDSVGLDSEYQYWSFMASYPVHAPLPPESITEAINLLTWIYTSLLLTSPIMFAIHLSCARSATSIASPSPPPPI